MVPNRDRWELSGIVDRELFLAAGASGFLGIDVPEEFGGGGVADFRFNVVIAEELQRADVNAAGSESRCTTTSACPTSCISATTSRSAAGCPESAPAN